MQVREAHSGDVDGILAIYNDAVANTTAIWNEILVDAENRNRWLEERQSAGYPVLVWLEDNGRVGGYSSFGDWRAWDGYRHTVEHSVYVRADMRGKGIGKHLMTELIKRARLAEKHVMVAGIEADNAASISLHRGLGFEHAGRLKEVGTKFGRWLDLEFMQLRL